MEQKFKYLCKLGSLEEAKILLKENPDIDISADNEYAFRWACENGNLELAKWLLEKKSDINISANNEGVFRLACQYGHLEVAKLLLEKKSDINISANNEGAFRGACVRGHLEVAKLLLEKKSDIDISADDEYAFCYACENGHLEVAKWLQTLNPEKYYFEIINNKIKNYKIIKIIENKIKIEKEQIVMCSVCDENLSNVQASCKHLYCESCITSWIEKSSSCPYFRESIGYDKLFKIEVVK
jgi:ankyrin repeat protein